MKTNVYLTVDTEHSMGGAWADPALRPVPTERRIFCRIDGKDHGIGWLCDELGRHKFRATFFAEMFCSLYFGRADTRGWCQYLLERGQDVELHTHLNLYYYAQQQGAAPRVASALTDDLASVTSPLRAELLERACDLFRYATGYHPKAFRAGNWHADRALMSDLAKAGIRLDCSFNPASRAGGSFAGETLEINALQRIDSLWELPLSVVRQSLPEPHLVDGMRPFDLVSLSSWEIRKALDEAHKARTPHIVAVLHSFSGVKPKDVQYWRMKPDRVVRHRVRCFLDHLAANRDRFRVSTCDELVTEMSEVQPSVGGIPPNLGFIHPLTRKVVQAVNSIYWV